MCVRDYNEFAGSYCIGRKSNIILNPRVPPHRTSRLLGAAFLYGFGFGVFRVRVGYGVSGVQVCGRAFGWRGV